jgi:hypothetical protein
LVDELAEPLPADAVRNRLMIREGPLRKSNRFEHG